MKVAKVPYEVSFYNEDINILYNINNLIVFYIIFVRILCYYLYYIIMILYYS